MKIVLTDVETVCGDGIDLGFLNEYGEVVSYSITSADEVAERVKDADVILCNKTPITAETMAAAPDLKYIGVFATGYNNIDIKEAKRRGITVCNAGSYSTDSVVQLVFSYILNFANRLLDYAEFTENGGWKRTKYFSPIVFKTRELSSLTLGIIGYGAIGRRVAEIAKAFGMKVLCYTRTVRTADGVEFVGFDELLSRSDIVSPHCPLTDETRYMFDKTAFSKFKTGAYFINTSRGDVVDEYALKDALESGKLSGAALDVISEEPMTEDFILCGVKNLIITPHSAWTPLETRKRLVAITKENLDGYFLGKPKNVIV